MVPYNHDRNPGLAQWMGGTMNATIVLDQAGHVSFTNLDNISGRVVLRCAKSADITSIVVKLEGESRTRLMSPPGQNGEKPRPQLEYHKILYKVQMAFPPADVVESRSPAPGGSVYTLPPGQHEYPFKFKIPFNNGCSAQSNQTPTLLSLEGVRPSSIHVKKTLPPTLTGFPGEAEIRYFVKVTVNRHSFFKENPRAYAPFNFFPIEPPRAPLTGSEVFARQKTNLHTAHPNDAPKSKIKGLFSKGAAGSAPSIGGVDAPSISIDARLPEPAILTCNSELPLRLVIKKLNSFNQMIYLQSLQVALIGYTKIRAHDTFRTESTSWVVTSKSNLAMPIGAVSDPVDTETFIDDRLWRGHPLPNTIAPSFTTCNVERTYQLDIRVGLSLVGASQSAAKAASIVLPLRLATLVYSGIAPPAEVLAKIEQARSSIGKPSKPISKQNVQPAVRRSSEFGANQVPPTPVEPSGSMADGFPVQAGTASAAAAGAEYDDAPPSYEDAIASDVPPVAVGNRPTYAPPPSGEDRVLGRDEKSAWAG